MGAVMISKSFAVMGVLTLLSGAAYAGSAPKELYGKSISVQWSESLTGTWQYEKRVVRNIGANCHMNIYISAAGRPFVRLIQTTAGAGTHQVRMGGSVEHNRSWEIAPGASSSDRVEFAGRSMAVYTVFESGARRIAIDVDANKMGCTASIINGKQVGNNIIRQGAVRGSFDASSVQIGSVTCSIREGNVFGQ
jgi:hypothetical protein